MEALGVVLVLVGMVFVYRLLLGRSLVPHVPSRVSTGAGGATFSFEDIFAGVLAALAVATVFAVTGQGFAGLIAGALVGVITALVSATHVESPLRTGVEFCYTLVGVVATVPALQALVASEDCYGPVDRTLRIAALLLFGSLWLLSLVATVLSRRAPHTIFASMGLGVFGSIEVLAMLAGPIGVTTVQRDGILISLFIVASIALGALTGYRPRLVLAVTGGFLALASLVEVTVSPTPGCGSTTSWAAATTVGGFAVAYVLASRVVQR
ncbi:hypothetical protein [Rhodococcus sp. 5G237]